MVYGMIEWYGIWLRYIVDTSCSVGTWNSTGVVDTWLVHRMVSMCIVDVHSWCTWLMCMVQVLVHGWCMCCSTYCCTWLMLAMVLFNGLVYSLRHISCDGMLVILVHSWLMHGSGLLVQSYNGISHSESVALVPSFYFYFRAFGWGKGRWL